MSWNLKFVIYLVVGGLMLGVVSTALAMGTAPKKEEPKYKLEILKMEIIPAVTLSPEVKATKKPGKK
jgi:hypothetical protein